MAVSWLKKGSDSAAAAQQEQASAEQRKATQGKMWRFWMKENEEARITFVDGELSPDKLLLPPRFYEHNVYLNGSWNNLFVCPEMSNPEAGEKCPLCEGGDRPSLVALFTVIDHRSFKAKDGTKSYSDTPKLLAAKSQTFEMLNKIALKRGGLAGCTFDVSRTGDKSASVGSMFDFTEKTAIDVLKAKYTRTFVGEDKKEKTVSVFVPADYEKEIAYRDAAELRALGFGKPAVTGGSPAGYGGATNTGAAVTNYDDHL